MERSLLNKSREYEATHGESIGAEERPDFHFSPRVGWMNDPNGFSWYNGQYHLFYQYNPYATHWDSMHWGHAVSKDLLHWEYLPAALAPDMEYDRIGCFSGSAIALPDGRQLLLYTSVNQETLEEHWEYLPAALAPDMEYDRIGCFSGSAIALPDGRQLLLYTSVNQETLEDGSVRDIQTQSVAVGDGLDYVKYEQNPVLTEKDIPEGASKVDFRDPKIWRGKDGKFYCVIGNRPSDGSGQILLYSSENGFDWKFVSILAKNENRYGKMWECPDFFELDGKHVLLTSPQDMLPEGLEYHNGNGTLCIIGKLDETTGTLKEEEHQSIDYGIDFYAPQTLEAPDGRRIMIAWMQNWDTTAHRQDDSKWFAQMTLPRELSVRDGRLYQNPVKELESMIAWMQNWDTTAHRQDDSKWFAQMTLPRELSVRDGRLYQNPVKELESLRRNKVEYQNIELEDNTISLDGLKGRRIDMELIIRPGDEEALYQKFAVRFAQNQQFYTALSFRPYESILKIDRKFSGSRRAYIHQRRCLVDGDCRELKLRMILDRFSVEVFVNDGRQTMSATIFTDQGADGISFFADGKVKLDVVKYDLIG